MSSRVLARGQRSLGNRYATRARRATTHPRAEALEDRRLLAGYFQAPIPFSIGGANPSSILTADFNRDGRPDLVALTDSGVSVLLNNGSGGFGAPAALNLGANETPKAIAVGDVNGDGQVDIVVALLSNTNVLTVEAFLNNGGTTFTAAAPVIANSIMAFSPNPAPPPAVLPSVIGVGVDPNTTASVALGDFNLDGKPDLAVAFTAPGATSSVVRVFQGNGDGTFQNGLGLLGSGPLSETPINGTKPLDLTVGDFNRDGAPDIAILTTAGLSIALNTKVVATPLPAAAPTPLAVGTNPNALVTTDFNRDGIPDLAVASDSGIDVLLGDGTGKFPTTNIMPLNASAPAAKGLAAIDFNRDGRPDLATFGSDGKLDVLTNTGAPSTTGLFAAPVTFDAGANPTTLAVADVNADALDDLLVGNAGSTNNLNVLLGGLDSAGPRILSTQLAPQMGTLTIQFQDNASGLLQSALANAANYKIFFARKKASIPITITSITVSAPSTPNGPQTVVVSFQPITSRALRQVSGFKIVVSSMGITDRAGNALDGVYNGVFPSGNGLLPISDFVQVITVGKKK